MAIELKPASPEEIARFKLAAAKRYQEHGLDPKQAEALFDAYMGKVAEQLGFAEPVEAPDAEKVSKVAETLKATIEEAKSEAGDDAE